MNFMWRSPKKNLSTVIWYESRSMAGVTFAVRRVSLGERIELTSRIRELCRRSEFLRAGDCGEQLDAAVIDLSVKAAYIDWGLMHVRGLCIQGRRVRRSEIVRCAPEALSEEILSTIKAELGLTEEERKNS